MTALLGADFLAEVRDALMSVGYAFVMVHLLAYAYIFSNRAISLSIGFVRTMVLASVATAVMVLVVGRTLSWGFGLLGALTMFSFLRFRVGLRDPRDIVFLFAALIIGLSAGAQTYGIGLVGTLCFGAVALYMNHVPLGQPTRYDAQLRFKLQHAEPAQADRAHRTISQACSLAVLAMVRPLSQGEASEYVYQLRFRRGQSRNDMMELLRKTPGLSDLSLMMEDLNVEV
jgi:Domain of unknown function (DUF4956)